jgi:DNA-binding response OmpR family regulator
MTAEATSQVNFNILIVDNDRLYSSGCKEFLESCGFHVYEAYSVANARALLNNLWLHLVIVDVRLTNDNDPKDKSGLELAKEIAPTLPTLILTRYPDIDDVRSAMKATVAGKSAVYDYIEKKKPLYELLSSIKELIGQQAKFNLSLRLDWRAYDRYLLASLIEPDLSPDLIPNRTAELEDLFRKLYPLPKDSLRFRRELWHDAGRVALAVFASGEKTMPESSIVVCGQKSVVEAEACKFEEHRPTIIQDETASEGIQHTIHYAAIKYVLSTPDLDSLHNLAQLYQTAADKTFLAAVDRLFDETLQAWHSDKNKPIHLEADLPVNALSMNDQDRKSFERRYLAVEKQLFPMGFKVSRSHGKIGLKLGGRSLTYADPLQGLAEISARASLDLAVTAPGNIRGETVLTDDGSHVWLTDFAGAGLVPVGWNAANLEAAVRFDWLDSPDLARRFELESSLVNSDFVSPDTHDLDPACKKAAHAIAGIRKRYSANPNNELPHYQTLVLIQAVQRLMDFDPSIPLTNQEAARMGQVWLALTLLCDKFQRAEDLPQQPLSTEVKLKDRLARTFLVGNIEKTLEPKPFSLLVYFLENPGRVCTRKELIEKGLKGEYDDEYLYSLVGKIRKAIGDDARHPAHLVTIADSGYRFDPNP